MPIKSAADAKKILSEFRLRCALKLPPELYAGQRFDYDTQTIVLLIKKQDASNILSTFSKEVPNPFVMDIDGTSHTFKVSAETEVIYQAFSSVDTEEILDSFSSRRDENKS